MARAAALPPRTQDLALALVLVVVNVGSVLPYRSQMHPFWAALLLVIAQAVPLTWRRTWPFTVLILAGVPRILYDQLGFGYAPIPLASTIAFYTAMVHCRPAVRRLVIVLAVIGTTQSQVAPGHNQPYDAIVSVLTTLTAWLATSRRWRAGPSGPRRSATTRWRGPRRRNAPGSPANCTTWWRTTSA
jgi:hypothetical protein